MSSKDTSKHKVLAAQYALNLSKRQSMVESWLSGSSATSGNSSTHTTSTAAKVTKSELIAVASLEEKTEPHFEFKALPSSVVGLGSTRSKLSHKQIRDAELRVASAAAARAEAALGNNAALRKLAKGLPTKGRGSPQAQLYNGKGVSRGSGGANEDSESEEESKGSSARRVTKSSQKSFFDAYRISKKKKK